MLETLCSLHGVSGNEHKVRDFVIQNISPYTDNITVDSMGNVIAVKKGTNPTGKKVMVCAHMDEVGFIISEICDNGFLKFKTVGGIDHRILLSKKVLVGKDNIPGVIGVKAVHLQSKESRKSVIKEKDMYIDIGAKDKDDAMKKVSLGDYASFDSVYRKLGSTKIKAKALDDRIGCYALLEAIKEEYDEDIVFSFSVQEEVGLRGARVLSHREKADVCIVLEGTNAADVPFSSDHTTVTNQGEGPSLSIMDGASVSNKNLNGFIMKLAKENHIPYQIKKSHAGGNDAGAIAYSASGCETSVISLPLRYIHSPVSVGDVRDIQSYLKLIKCVLKNISEYQPRRKEVLK
ncbi:MAG: M42 family metallopeptidase [Ruminococcaceae bacterium]|nr:M42 family metallopeptidase [Oscillospiraceae bacterium]